MNQLIHAIKPVYDRKSKTYAVDYRTFYGGNLASWVAEGYYLTDDLLRALGSIVAGKCEWYNKLPPAKQTVVFEWLKTQ
jgi:hypothetical protein